MDLNVPRLRGPDRQYRANRGLIGAAPGNITGEADIWSAGELRELSRERPAAGSTDEGSSGANPALPCPQLRGSDKDHAKTVSLVSMTRATGGPNA